MNFELNSNHTTLNETNKLNLDIEFESTQITAHIDLNLKNEHLNYP